MISVLTFILGVLVGGLLGGLLVRQVVLSEVKKEAPLEGARQARRAQIEEAKQKIFEVLQERERITNDEVQDMLGVSDATATNYLQELEEEDKIVQQGKTGQAVFYTLSERLK